MSGIGIYCQITNQHIDQSLSELVTVAKRIKALSNQNITVFLVGENIQEYIKDVLFQDVDEVCCYNIKNEQLFNTANMAKIISFWLKEKEISYIFIAAAQSLRDIFARVAVRLHTGMTADCTDIQPEVIDGKLQIKQIKPSFGSQVMISCEIIKNPMIITIRTGGFEAAQIGGNPNILTLDTPFSEDSRDNIKLIEIEKEEEKEGIQGADKVVCIGRGCLEKDNLDIVKQFAKEIGAVIAGTRPMADNGYVPFEYQVGQTGCIIRPKICFTFGISGAIQFTEGIKGNPIIISTNKDPQAPIFNISDYAIIGDISDIFNEI